MRQFRAWRRCGRACAWAGLGLWGAFWIPAMQAGTPSAGIAAADAVKVGSPAGVAQGCLRLVVDRGLGLRWRLEPQGPGRPNRLVPVGEGEQPACAAGTESKRGQSAQASQQTEGRQSIASAAPKETSHPAVAMHPVIQVGEAIVVVQSGSTVVARFPAVAMAAAAVGAWLPARLQVGNGSFGKLGGHRIRVQAIAPGLARWDGQQMEAGW